jgi:fibrillarin-like rRNA methylase
MDTFEIWIYRIIIGAILTFAGWYAKRLVAKVEQLIVALNNLTTNFKLQGSDVLNIKTNCEKREKEVSRRLEENEDKLNDHEERIRKIEHE